MVVRKVLLASVSVNMKILSWVTHFDERGLPVCERLRQEDLKIVPHNRAILMDCNGHCNVEFSAGVRCILYLNKYLYKGPKKSTFYLNSENENSESRDEISLYIKGRLPPLWF